MKKYHVAICDDEDFYVKDIVQYIYTYECETGNKLEIFEFTSAKRLITEMKKNHTKYHMIFLDVEMPEMSGMEAAKLIRELEPEMVICFVTNYEQYALSAFQVEALGYLMKPVQYAELKSALNRGIINVQYQLNREKSEERFVNLTTNRSELNIDMNNILYIEKDVNRCIFHLTTGEVVCYETLNNVFKKLDQAQFVFCHQGYIVNFQKVKEVKHRVVCLGDGVEIPLSRKHAVHVKARYMDKIHWMQNEAAIR